MQNKGIAEKTGSAFVWKAIQLAGTKGIYFVRTLLLAYILLPQDFGLFAVTLIAVDFLMSVTDFGLISALVHESNPSAEQYNSAWSVNILRGFLISVLVFIFAPFISQLFAQPEAASLIRIAALKPIIETSASIKIAELTRNLNFRHLSYLKLSDALISSIVSVVLASVIGVWGLLIGILSGSLVFSVLSYFFAPYRPKFSINPGSARTLIDFSKWIYFSVLVSVAGSITIQIIITRELGLTELGLYFLAIHLAFLPSEIIKEIFGSVMFPVFAQIRYDKERLTDVYKSFLNGIFVLIVPVCILMIFTAPYLVHYILGSKWNGTVQLIQIFAVVNLVGLIGETAVPLLTGTGKTSRVFVLDAVQSVLLLLLCWTFIKFWDVNGAAAAWIPAVFVSQILSFYYISKMLIIPFKGITALVTSVFASSLAGTFIGYLIIVNIPGITGFIGGISLSGLLIASALFFTDNYYKLGIRRYFILAFPRLQNFSKY